MSLRFVEFVDTEGRKWRRGLPDVAPDSEAIQGVPYGPPSLQKLGLPLELDVRLHNQLYDRSIYTNDDARRRVGEVTSAIQAALRLDAHTILAIYEGSDSEGANAGNS